MQMRPQSSNENGKGEPRKISDRKLKANRENAQKSTGPKTPRGKSYRRMNSLKHGFLARDLFSDSDLQTERPTEYLDLYTNLRKELRPEGPSEEAAVEQIAACLWRRRRLWRFENAEMLSATSDVFIRAQGTGVNAFPEDEPIVKLLHTAKKELEINRQVSKELMEKILAHKRAAEIWPMFEEMARRALREANFQADDAQLVAIQTVIFAIRYFEICPREVRAVRRVDVEQEAIPNTDALDKIVRYSGMVERELHRGYERLERLQRRRKGEPVLPSLNVNVAGTHSAM